MSQSCTRVAETIHLELSDELFVQRFRLAIALRAVSSRSSLILRTPDFVADLCSNMNYSCMKCWCCAGLPEASASGLEETGAH